MSDTPLTDAAISQHTAYSGYGSERISFDMDHVEVNDCRSIERELRERIAELEAELAESDAVRERLAYILAETSVALKGPNGPLSLHSWHDLAEVASTMKLTLDIAEELLAQERAARSTQP